MLRPLFILITGATSGIGRHAALHLAGLGHHVFASGRNLTALQDLKRESELAGYSLDILELHVDHAESRQQCAQSIHQHTRGYGLDILINNAGYGQMGPIELVSAEQLRAQFETNVISVVEMIRLFIPAMRKRGKGRVINVSSIGGRVTFPFAGAYHASKYALEALSDALRIELNPFGIKVILIEPGPIRTQFAQTGLASLPNGDDAVTDHYRHILQRAEQIQHTMDRYAASPRATSKALEMAIHARWPSDRYVAPSSNRLIIWLIKCLPSRFLDWCYKLLLTRKA